MPEIALAKRQGCQMVGVGDAAEAFLKGIGRGEVLHVNVKHFRHGKFFRKVMATLREVYDNQDELYDWDRFLDQVKLHAGHTDSSFIEHDGEIFEAKRPATVSIYGCPEDRFQKFAANIPKALEKVLPGPQYNGIREFASNSLQAW